MQTFLPYRSYKRSVRCLDYRRLGKQRVEASQLIYAITCKRKSLPSDVTLSVEDYKQLPYCSWAHHPCAIMWRNHLEALKDYHNKAITEWVARGYRNTMELASVDEGRLRYPAFPRPFFPAMRSNLLRKDPKFYSRYGWKVPHDLEYVWVE